MTDLHIALIALGALVIAAVVAFNSWQERRVRRKAEDAFGRDHPDVLFTPGERREPTLGELPAKGDAPVEAELAPGVFAEPESDSLDAPAGIACVIANRSDTVAVILADDPVTREQLDPLLDALQAHTTPVNVEGIVDEQWQPIEGASRQSWRELRVGLQIASRSGPLTQAEIERFNEAVSAFAASVGAVSQRESPAVAAARALELDRFCADADVEVAVNVVGQFGATFAMARVKAIALEHGLSETGSGHLVSRARDSSLEFVVRHFDEKGASRESSYATGLTLALDLPNATDAVEAFTTMVSLAQAYCEALGGEMVDDSRKPLSAAGVAAIRRQLEAVVAEMEKQGIPAGSPLARRLFS